MDKVVHKWQLKKIMASREKRVTHIESKIYEYTNSRVGSCKKIQILLCRSMVRFEDSTRHNEK